MSDTLSDIREQCRNVSKNGADYDDRMLHPVPDADVVNKETFLRERFEGKVVLSLGCTGEYQTVVDGVAKVCYGINKEKVEGRNFIIMDLDEMPVDGLPWLLDPTYNALGAFDYVWAGEILEHLTNPGNCLRALRICGCPILISVPSAFSNAGAKWMAQGIENVHIDHVAYYSYWTLLRLIEKCGYRLSEWHWYEGVAPTAEGLIFIVEDNDV